MIGTLVWVAAGIAAGPWTLPRNLEVKDGGPRAYRMVVEHTITTVQGQVLRKERIEGTYTRGLPGGEAQWSKVLFSAANGAAPFGPIEKRDFMEGFRYRVQSGDDSLKPEFFRDFPPMAMHERNLVWDVQMFEAFGQTQFAYLKLNEIHHFETGREMSLAGAGRFQNRDVQLSWTGLSKRNGTDCIVIEYRALFNPFEVDTAALKMKARSHYWGQIWVSLKTKQVEYGTLYEDVLGEMKMPGQDSPRAINVFRQGVFEPISGK